MYVNTDALDFWSFSIRLLAALVLGAAAYTMVTIEFAANYLDKDLSADPTRLVQGLIGGIGFLGAGSIMQSKDSITGVTTAATVWITGAIGVVCGMSWYPMAFVTVSLTLLVLVGLGWVKDKVVDDE